MQRKHPTIGTKILAFSTVALMGFGFSANVLAKNGGNNDRDDDQGQVSFSEQVRLCVQQRNQQMKSNKHIPFVQRHLAQLNFRVCMRQALNAKFGHSTSSTSSTSSVPSSSSSSMSSSSVSTSSSSNSSNSSSNSSVSSVSSSSVSSSSNSSNSSMSSSSSNHPVTRNITIEDFAYAPSTVTVPKGSTVIWTNEDSMSHTVTSDSGTELSSGTISYDATYSHVFTQPGTYYYHCSFHPSMHGTVIVTE